MDELTMDMLHGRLGGKILFFSLPLVLTGILQQFFNAADIVIVGRFVGKEAMAAVGGMASVIGLMVGLFVGLSMGTNVVIAQRIGRADAAGIARAADTSLTSSLLIGILLILAGEWAASPFLSVMSLPGETYALSETYLRIYLLGMPAILLINTESAMLRAQGDSRSPLICLTASGILNIGLNLFFVLFLGMGVDGVAWATALSNAAGAMLLFMVLLRGHGSVNFHMHVMKIDWPSLWKIVAIGIPSGVQSAMFSLPNIIIQEAINSLGTNVMAASAAAFNIEVVMFYVTSGFGQACTTFIGQNYGAGNIDRCRRVLKISLAQCMAVTLTGSLALLVAGNCLLAWFNPDPEVIAIGFVRLEYILWFEGIAVLIEIYSGAMRGYGHSFEPAAIAVIGICLLRVIWILTVFAAHPAFEVIMVCYPLSWLVTAVASVWAHRRIFRRVQSAGNREAGEQNASE